MGAQVKFIEFRKGMPTGRGNRYSWVIEALLRSRETAGLNTGGRRPDEDVNVYLADLICRYAEPGGRQAQGDCVTPYDADLHAAVSASRETRSKYTLYRCNADHILVSLGLFDNAWLRSPRQSAFHWAPTRAESISRGRLYYGKAALYATRLDEGRRGLGDLLGKLETGFEEYLRILETMRGEHFNLRRRFSDGEWLHFCREMGIGADKDLA